ncbi:MarR family winged helix-turn-helix transcriptional regulator [Lapillicoccus jejuensis]|uniref:DNA-binding MarR family transcriptional regulator n=1 Tax=Lapillicoccus jejuensis TaxID=402171 RepID=A0A542E3J6_9MICO|nr:MarR family transcriptional regulator [Lapillicoccus jejuensis]TQJ09913.1 DNA-binding MarR family transcriptional regulator [Lapillicoccus jejuensis]
MTARITSTPTQDRTTDEDATSTRLGVALRQLTLQVERHRLALSAYLGCSVTETQLMSHLLATGPMTIGEVADAMGLRSSVVTGIADRLEAKGFVARQEDGGDRRRRILVLRGDRADEVRDAVRLLDEAVGDLGARRATQLAEALELSGARLDGVTDGLLAREPLAPSPRRLR